jgi:hypothetical protein
VALFRRAHAAEPVPAASTAEDSPATLRQSVFQLHRYINRNSGRLPVEAVVKAQWVADTLREIIDTSDVRELDIYAVLSVKGIVNDYLPTTLSKFLALDPGQLDVARPSGRRPSDLLLEQIDALQGAATAVLVAAQEQDADALITQGNFLRTKFTGSDLDL